MLAQRGRILVHALGLLMLPARLHGPLQKRIHIRVLGRIDRQQLAWIHDPETTLVFRIQFRPARRVPLRVANQGLQDLVARRIRPPLHHEREIRAQIRRRGRRAAASQIHLTRIRASVGRHTHARTQHRHVPVHHIRRLLQIPHRIHRVHRHLTGEIVVHPRLADQVVHAGPDRVVPRRDHHHAVTQRVQDVVTHPARIADVIHVRHVDDPRAGTHRVTDARLVQVNTLTGIIHTYIRSPSQSSFTLVKDHVGGHGSAGRDALDARAAVPSIAIAHDQRHHTRTMGYHEPAGRIKSGIVRGRGLRRIGLPMTRLVALGHELVRHVRARQRGIVGHNRIVKHRDLHALARDPLGPRVTHAHIVDTPIHTIRSHRRRHTQPHTSQHRHQRRHHAAHLSHMRCTQISRHQ